MDEDYEDKKKLRSLIKGRNRGNEQILNELSEINPELNFAERDFKSQKLKTKLEKIDIDRYILSLDDLIFEDRYYDYLGIPGSGQTLDNDLVQFLLENK